MTPVVGGSPSRTGWPPCTHFSLVSVTAKREDATQSAFAKPEGRGMPKVTEDRQLVSYPPAFAKLDKQINDPDTGGQFHQLLTSHETPGFTAGGPFAGDAAVQDHWKSDWVGPAGQGGNYWPYATDVDVFRVLTDGLVESSKKAMSTGKVHNTLWVCSGEPPAGPVDKAAQDGLFHTAVIEGDGVVTLVIMTPYPV